MRSPPQECTRRTHTGSCGGSIMCMIWCTMSHTFEHSGHQQVNRCMHHVLTNIGRPLLPCCWGYSLGLFFRLDDLQNWWVMTSIETWPSPPARKLSPDQITALIKISNALGEESNRLQATLRAFDALFILHFPYPCWNQQIFTWPPVAKWTCWNTSAVHFWSWRLRLSH